MNKEQRFCQSCGMPLTEDVLGTNADGSKKLHVLLQGWKIPAGLHDGRDD